MTLLDDIDKFLAKVPVNGSFSWELIFPFIKQAELKYLVPVIGKELYLELGALDGSATDEQSELLDLIYNAVANIALSLYLPLGNVQISDSGIQIVSTNDRKTAFEWQVNRAIDAAASLGMDGLELVLQYLGDNIASFGTYADSDAYTANNSLFINTAEQFNQAYNINRSRLTFVCLYAVLKQVEKEVIIPQIGKDVAADLKTKIKAKTLSDDEKELVEWIQKAEAFLAVRDILPQLSVELSPQGLAINYISKSLAIKASEPAPDSRITSLLSHVKEKAIQYLDALPAMLPGYVAPATGEIYNIDNTDKKIISLF